MKLSFLNLYQYVLTVLAGLAFTSNLLADTTIFSNGFEDVTVGAGSYTYTDGPTWRSPAGDNTWYYSTGYGSGSYTPPGEGSIAAQVRGGIQASAGHTFVAGTTYRINALTSTNPSSTDNRTIMLGNQSLGANAINTGNAFAYMTVAYDGTVSASNNAANQVVANFQGIWKTIKF